MLLDEGENPQICQILYSPTQESNYKRLGLNLNEYINISIESYLEGEDIF